MFHFNIGNVRVTCHNIDELKEYVCEISEKLAPGEEHSKYISDFIYDVEAVYQTHHGLGPDNWDAVH